MEKKMILDEDAMRRSLTRMSHEIIEHNKGVDDVVLIGIKTRGEFLSERIAAFIERVKGVRVECIPIDFQAWRDSLVEHRPLPEIDFCVKDKVVILVDDVLFKGRTVRAALEGILHYGRAKEIQLAVLVDRGHRELPIRADYVGKNIPSSLEERIAVHMKETDGEDCVTIEKGD